MIQMNDIQTILTVAYSILYGIMLDSCGGLNLFPYAWLYTNNEQPYAGRRIATSFIIIVFLPISFFAIVYAWLNNFVNSNLVNININFLFNVLIVSSIFLISQMVFACYRFFHILMVDWNLYDEKLKKARTLTSHDKKCLRLIGQEEMIARFIKIGPNNSGQYFATYIQLILTYLGLIIISGIKNGLNFQLHAMWFICPILFFIITLCFNARICEVQRKMVYLVQIFFIFLI